MLRRIIIVIATVIVVFVLVAALQPSEYRVARQTRISAPAAVVFAQLNDLHKWQEISPWAKLDPAAKNTFAGPTEGVGASLAWAGNSQVGEGRMTITESRANDLIRMKLDFVKPFASTAMTEFTFKPESEQTTVTWSMSGRKTFVCKAIGLCVSMDKMIGGDFETGLANLKAVSENHPQQFASAAKP